MESLLGSTWRDVSTEEKLDVLPHLWRELRDEFARPGPSYHQPRASSADAPVKNPFPEEQRMVQAILEVVLDTTSTESDATGPR